MTEQLDVSVEDLLLDQENPRLGSAASQNEALQALIELNPEHFKNLMNSIKENGLDPGDSLYVIAGEEDDDYIVLDGNRRLSALMVLHNPTLLEGVEITDRVRRRLTKSVEGFDASKFPDIRCVEFETRDEANDWIFRRHTGEQSGEGRIPWGRLEISRFTNDRSVIDVLDFVGRNAEYSDEDWEATRTMIESNQSSTLSRVLQSKAAADHIGLQVTKIGDETVPTIKRDPDFVLKVVTRIMDDLRDGVINSRSLNTASNIENYFEDFPSELQPSASSITEPTELRKINLKDGQEGDEKGGKTKSTSKKPRTRTAAGKRKTLAPRKHAFKSPTIERGAVLQKEATKLKLDEFALSSAFVLRAFIELAIIEYAKANGISRKGTDGKEKSLTGLGEDVRKHISDDPGIDFSSSDLRPFKSKILTPTSAVSIQSLNGFVHSKFAIPSSDDLRAGWEASIPLFVSAFGEA